MFRNSLPAEIGRGGEEATGTTLRNRNFAIAINQIELHFGKSQSPRSSNQTVSGDFNDRQ
jgi:hypothetical protein